MSKKLFISYSHDSDEHAKKVLQFANELRKAGYDVLIDQHVAAPSEGWAIWMENGIADADFILLVITETYSRRITLKEKEGIGFGCQFEGKLIHNAICNNASRNEKFLPVLFDSANKLFIPSILNNDTYYPITGREDFLNLRRRLDNAHQAPAPELGEYLPIEPPEDPGSFFDDEPVKAVEEQRPVVELNNMPSPCEVLFGRENEMDMLNKAWDEPKTRIISFIAWGGVGKSSLISHWIQRMDELNFKGAKRVFAHSFYSQGSSDQSQVSVDDFLNQAFSFVKYTGKKPESDHEKGKLLAELFCQQKTLLVLDGLEPMQYPPGVMQGKLKDQSLIVFLKYLAFNLDGLCVITSRVPIAEIKNAKRHDLGRLSKDAGLQLFAKWDIKGSEKEKIDAIEEVKGHALTLTLLASYLNVACDGAINKRDTIDHLIEENLDDGEHAKHVMNSYEKWLGQSGNPDLNILYLMSLFDRPADQKAVDELIKSEPIPGVTDKLHNISNKDWQFALERLHRLQLIANPKDGLDCHPLVREYFSKQLKLRNLESYQEAHKRLYEYYKNLPEKKFPDTIEEMEPLFIAVSHGCQAGLHQDALDTIYWPRIKRENQHYSTRNLGAYAKDLACVAGFFERTWDRPVSGLTKEDQAVVFSWAGFRLRGLGRLSEAIEPLKAAFQGYLIQQDWRDVATNAGNVSELYVSLGLLEDALAFGQKSVDYADKSDDKFQLMSKRTTLADVLHQVNEYEKAKALFLAAENIQQERSSKYKILYSLQGFRYCSLLLDLGEVDNVIERTEQTLQLASEQKWLLDIALDLLSLGRAHMLKALKHKQDFSAAKRFLNEAVEGLRKAGGQDDLPLGILARASLFTYQKEYIKAWQDLDEVFEIASYSQMLLFLTDYHLEACRNIHHQLESDVETYIVIEEGQTLHPSKEQMLERFSNHLIEAEALINKTGYHRRDKELAELKEISESIL